MPDPKELQGDLSWSKALAIAFSVGIRPCTGAILVLVFALSQGLLWAGIFATFAMAIGTALTVSVLASTAVGSRDLAARLGGGGSGWATAVADSAGVLGASLVLIMGAVFFMGSLQPQAPF
jgi:nickel/cobalt transporter (NicO) family protein